MNWHCDYMRLNNNWIWNFDGNMDGIWDFNFFNDWNFNLLIDWEFLGVVVMDGVNLIRHFDLDGFAEEIKFTVNEAVFNFRRRRDLLSASTMPTAQNGLGR